MHSPRLQEPQPLPEAAAQPGHAAATPQPLRTAHHALQPSLSGLPPGELLTPHAPAAAGDGDNEPGFSSGSEAEDSGSGTGARSSVSRGQVSQDSSPHPGPPLRHRTQPSWPRLSTSGVPKNATVSELHAPAGPDAQHTGERLCSWADASSLLLLEPKAIDDRCAAEAGGEDEDPAELFDLICQLGAPLRLVVLSHPCAWRTCCRSLSHELQGAPEM